MDNIRLLLVLSLAAVLFLIYQAWVEDYGTQRPAPAQVEQPATGLAADSPQAPPADAPPAASLPTSPGAVADPSSTQAQVVTVETDVVRAEISTQGGTIQSLWLKDYARQADDPEDKFRLLKPEPPNLFIVQSGLVGSADDQLPNHNALFTPEATQYRLGKDDELTVVLHWSGDNGVEVVKRYRFARGSYVVHTEQEIINRSGSPIVARDYNQLQRSEHQESPDDPRFVRTYTGGVYFGPEVKYKKESFEEMTKRPLDVNITDGWIAMIQHYFMAAWIPPEGVDQSFYTKVVDGSRYIIGKFSPTVTLQPDGSYTFQNRLFAGPKLQDQLAEIAPGLELAVDYGWLTILAEPIYWLLETIHSLVGNWGWSIIILTILIKAAFYKLSETSYKSMAHMRQVAPRLQALKDRYGDDKERMNQAMMELYKKEKINPLGGCLPILVQIPVFIALYWVLLESVELRHAPFILWIDNLTAPDPYFVLPLIMGVSMLVQHKLNPPPPDPIQAKILLALPFVFTVFFAFFPSGLVLYWTVNQLLSIAQQWHITRAIEKADAARRSN